MATFAWPTNDAAFSLSAMVWKPRVLSNSSESPLNGDVQTSGRPGSRWGMVLTFQPATFQDRARLVAFLERLSGQEHRISIGDPLAFSPRGTIALSGVTIQAAAAQFATQVTLAGCGAGATLLRGDWLKFSTGQAVKAVLDATADGAGVMTVTVRHMLRAALSAGSAVTTNNVTALYVLADPNWSAGYSGSHAEPFSIELVEVFS
jgi:hypothetical protein